MKASATLLLLLLLSVVGMGQAATWYISPYGNQANNGTSPQEPFLTLSAALHAASAGDTIEAANGVYSGGDNVGLALTFDVTLQGKAEASTVFQATDDEDDLFSVLVGTVTFSHLSVVGVSGSSSKGVDVASGAGFSAQAVTFSSVLYGVYYSPYATVASVDDCTFSSSVFYGAAVYATSSSVVTLPTMTVSDSLFQSPIGVYVDLYSSGTSNWSQLTVSGCVFQASNMLVKDGEGPHTITIKNSQFSDFVTTSSYGPVYIYSQVPVVEMSGVSVSHTTTSLQAAVYVASPSSAFSGTLSLSDCWISFSIAGGSPSGVVTKGYEVTVTDSGFVGNDQALLVEGYYSLPIKATITNSVFFGNDGTAVVLQDLPLQSSISGSYFIQNSGSYGGALYMTDTTVDVSGCYFYENESSANGGALYATNSANATVLSSAFGYNTAVSGGAAAGNSNAGISFRSTSFSGNSASSNGGAVYTSGNSRLTVLLCSFSANNADNGGGWYSNLSPVNGEMLLISGNNATESGGGFGCSGNGVSILNGWISNNRATTGPAYACSDNCNTYLSNVYVASNNGESGCANDFVTHPLFEVKAAVERELSILPQLDMEYILALVKEHTSQ